MCRQASTASPRHNPRLRVLHPRARREKLVRSRRQRNGNGCGQGRRSKTPRRPLQVEIKTREMWHAKERERDIRNALRRKPSSGTTGRGGISLTSGIRKVSPAPYVVRTHTHSYLPDANGRKFASEQRRVKRINDRQSDTICFACREKGHAARYCTNTIAADALEGEQRKSKSGRDTVGICYRSVVAMGQAKGGTNTKYLPLHRCGSRRHNLSKCRELVDPENPLPFASCFVCSGKGHLASKCPKNQSGIYPNGGCCKLCKETNHLAKDCPMRQPGTSLITSVAIVDH